MTTATQPTAVEDVRVAVTELASVKGLPVFAGALLVPAGTLTAVSSSGWQAFIASALSVGAPLLYVHHDVLCEDDLPECSEDDDPELRDAIENARSHLGESGRLLLAFTAGGVVHTWELAEQWWSGIVAVDDLGDDPLSDHLWRAESDPGYDALAEVRRDWTGRLLAATAFVGAPNGEAWSVARQLIPELAAWNDEPDDPDNISLSSARRRSALRAYDDARAELPRVRAEREDQARQHCDALVTELLADPEFRAGNKASQERRAGTLLVDRFGVRSRSVRDTIVFHAREKASKGAQPQLAM